MQKDKKNNPVLTFINMGFNKGQKLQSYNRFLIIFNKLKRDLKKTSTSILKEFFINVEIFVYIYRKKIGANIYQIPLYLKKKQRINRGILNFYKIVKVRKERGFLNRIYLEIFDIMKKKSATINLRNNIYLLASDNKANLKYVYPRTKRNFVGRKSNIYLKRKNHKLKENIHKKPFKVWFRKKKFREVEMFNNNRNNKDANNKRTKINIFE
jgi:ribosomal protein S7